jgi:hypothetical protein
MAKPVIGVRLSAAGFFYFFVLARPGSVPRAMAKPVIGVRLRGWLFLFLRRNYGFSNGG